MSADITSLRISVASDGISQAAKSLNDLAAAATKVEQVSKTTKTASDGLSASQAKSAASTEALLAKMQKQVDLLGANTSQTNSYNMAMKKSSDISQQMAAMLGAEVDAYKRLSASQTEATRMNKSLDASYAKLSKEADKYYAAQAKGSAAGKALNDLGYRQQQFQKLSATQAEAIAMNKAFDASILRQKEIMQSRDIAMHAESARQYALAQAEAIRMNNAMGESARRSAGNIRESNLAMQEARGLARGLSGSLGALWLTYGAFAGMAVGVAIGASLKNIAKIGTEVEKQLNFVFALSDKREVVNLDSFLKITESSVQSVTEAANAMRALAQNGLSVTESLSVLPSVLNLATVGEMSVGQAAIAATGAVSAFGLTMGDAERVSDIFAKTAATSNTSVLAMTESMKQASTVASMFGLTIEETAAYLGTLAKINITGGAAGTSLTNMLTGLYEPTEQAKKAMIQLGVSAYDSAGKMKNSVILLEDMKRASSNLSEQVKTDIFGAIVTARGMKSLKLFMDNLDTVKSKIEDNSNALGFMKGVVEKLENDTSHAFIRMGVIIENEFTRMFANAAPEVHKLGIELGNLFKGDATKTHINEITGEVERNTNSMSNLVRNLAIVANALVENLGSVTALIGGYALYRAAIGYSVTAQVAGITTTTTLGALYNTYKASVIATTTATTAATAASATFNAAQATGTATTLMYNEALVANKAVTAAATAQTAAYAAVALPALAALKIALAIAAAAWLLLRDNTTDASNANTIMSNTISTIGDQLDKEATRLRRSISLWDERNQKFKDSSAVAPEELIIAENTVKSIAAQIEKLSGKKISEFLPKGNTGNVDHMIALSGESLAVMNLAKEYEKATTNLAALQKQSKQSIVIVADKGIEKTLQDVQSLREKMEAFKKEGTAVGSKGANDYLETSPDRRAIRAKVQSIIDDVSKINTKPIGEAALKESQRLLSQYSVDFKKLQDELNKEVAPIVAPEDKHGDRVRLRTQMAAIDAEIEAGRRANDEDKKRFQSEYKQGLIGEISLIEKVRVAEADSQASIIDGEIKKMRILGAIPDQSAGYVEAEAKVRAAIKATADAAQVASGSRAEYIARLTDLNNKSDAKMYESNGQYAAAYDSLFKSKHDVEIGRLQDSYNTSKDLSEKTAIMKRQEVLQSEYAAGTQAAQNKEAVYNFNVLAESTSNALRGIQTATEGLGIEAMFNAASAASATLAANMDALREKQSAITGDKEANEAEARMIRLAETQRKLWSGVGESISKSLGDAFGNAGKAAGDMLMVSVRAGQTEERLAANKAKAFKDIEQLQGAGIDRAALMGKVEVEYANKASDAKIKMYSDMAGAAKGFFKEESAGYRAMETAQKLLTIISLVESAKRAIAFAMENVALSVTIGAIAALAGILGGSSGPTLEQVREAQKKRIETQGTRTLLGDSSAKSDSIQKSLDLLAEYAFQDLEYSNKMLTAMQSIASALTGVSKGLALTQGLMSGTNFGTLEGSTAGFGASVPVVGKLLSSIFGGGTTSTITGSGIKLDGTVGQLADKQGSFQQYEEIAKKKSGGWFSKDKNWTVTNTKPLEDDIVNSFARTFGAVREGLLDVGTGIGLSADTLAAQINTIPIKMTAELRGLKGKELEEAVTAIFSAQIDNIAAQALSVVVPFAKMGEGLFETAVRVGNTFRVIDLELQSIGTTFGAVGTGSMAARMGLVEMMGGLEEFVSKTDFFKENFLTEAEQLAPISKAVAAEMARLGQSSVDTEEAFKALVLAQDLSTTSGQEMYTSLMNVAPAFKKVTEYADTLRQALYDAADTGLGVLESSIGREKDTAQAAYDAQIAIINAQRTSAEKVFNDTKTALTETLNAATASNTAFKSLASSLKSTLDGMYLVTQQAMRRQSAQEMITMALQVARNTGVLPTAESLSEALKTVAQPSENLFATFEDYATDFGVTAGKIADLNDITNRAVSKTDTAIDIAKMQLSALESNHKDAMSLLTDAEKSAKAYYDAEVARFDAILANAQEQLAVANGTQTAMLSLSAAIRSLGSLLQAATAATAKAQYAGTVAAPAATSTSISSLYESLLGRDADAGGLAYWESRAAGGATTAQIADEIYRSPEYLAISGSHANGLDDVPQDGYIARLHKGEMVLPATSAKAVRDDASNTEILAALEKLCEENSAENRSMASNLTTLRKLFERVIVADTLKTSAGVV